jgi:hypothetical protein
MKDLVIVSAENRARFSPFMESVAVKFQSPAIRSTGIRLIIDVPDPGADVALQDDMPGKTHLLGEEQQLAFAKIVKGSAPASRRAIGWNA